MRRMYAMPMASMTSRAIRIDDDLWQKAAEAAKANGENVSVVIRRALVQYVKENQS